MKNLFTTNGRQSALVFTIAILCSIGLSATAFGQATSITSTGYRANEGGGGAITAEWTTGNLGNTWAEGEWVPYQLIISNVQTDFPNMDGFPDIHMSYDFTSQGNRFVDLVRGIQAGTTVLADGEGWVNDAGTAYPDATRAGIEDAQNDIGNADPLDNEWTNFSLLNLPNSQVNRASDFTSENTPDAAEATFTITKADLVAAGIPLTTNTIVIYYQLHESRSFVWANSLQEQYDQYPTDDWGGYLYSLGAFPADVRNGAGWVPGSSGHIEVEFAGGAKTVPIPIPERLPGAVSGLKWQDTDGNGLLDNAEQTLSGWRIYVSGSLEGINFETFTVTDETGNYSFPNLTSNVVWNIVEDAQRFNPASIGWMQTYPQPGDVVGVGTGFDFGFVDDSAAYGWKVALSADVTDQGDMNFGNKLCAVTITCPPDATIGCNASAAPANTGWPLVDANCPPIDTTYSDNVTEGDCDVDGYLVWIERTWIVTDVAGMADTCVQNIYITDETDPVITGVGPDDTIECPAVPQFSTPNATDNCGDPEFGFNDVTTPGACPQEYSVTRTWTATDACGNSVSVSQTITVEDNTAPVITGVGGPETIECPAEPVFSNPSATDACGPADLSFNDVTTPGNCPQEYSVTRTWTAADSCGNTSTASQTITVEDNTAPVITGVGGPETIECPAEPVFSNPSATDACGPADLSFNDVTTPGNCPQEYSVTRTWTAADSCGNTSTASQTITVEDNTAPVITGVGGPETIECPAEPVFSNPSATDACGPVDFSFNDVTTPGACPQEYSVTRTWTATDDCGNSSTASQTITVEDNTAPVITGVGGPQTIECPAEPVFSNPDATDACGPVDFSFNDVTTPGNCPQEFSVTRTWTAVDDCGNTSTASQTITVEDNTAPVISCPNDVDFSCESVGAFGEATAVDACDPDPSIDFSDDTVTTTCPLEIVRTWTATDACGNSSSCQQNIIINDETPPVISGVGGPQTIECPAEPVFSNPSASDNCGDPTLEYNDQTTPGACPQEYSVTRTWTATDACGNTATASQTITVVDNTAPVITGVGGPETIECPAEPVFSNPSATDACGPADLGYNDVTTPGACPQEYSITRTWTATDDCGNASTASQTITVVDNTAPVITGVGGPETIECPAEPQFSNPSATDACGPADLGYNDETTPGACPQEYSITRTWTATDDCGNASTASQTITVVDNTAPVISGVGGNETIECPSEPNFSNPSANDACGPVDFSFNDETTPGACPQEFSVTRTWTAVDECGNTSTASQTITVEDNTPPVISCPSDVDFSCESVGAYGEATAVDACDPNPSIVSSDDTVTTTCPLEIVRTWTATDACGNSSSCQQNIIIRDETPPVISGVGGPQTIECPAEPVFSNPSASDNCGDPTLEYSDQTTPGACPQEYSVTRTWTATDACGNTATASQAITVVDNTAPVITGVGGPQTIDCPAEPQFSTPSATDACGPASLSHSDQTTPGDCPQEYAVTRTWTAADSCGNTSTASQTITVVDNTPPVISGVGGNETLECPAEPNFSTPSATDACGPADLSYADDTTFGDCPAEYSITRTWTAADSCGNTSSATQTITVEDNTPPVIACAAADTIGCEDVLEFTPPTATDDCDSDPAIIMVGTDTAAGPNDGEFIYTRYWYAMDTCGNASDTCSQEIFRESCPREFCTYTMGGWGTDCPDSQADDMFSTQPGCIRDHYFDDVFPDGVTIGHPDYYTAHWTNSSKVRKYLPAGGTPGTLDDDYHNPTYTSAGVLAGQILALKLNVGFSEAGIPVLLGLLDGGGNYGAYVIDSCGGPFAGLTVNEFLAVADMAVGGNTAVLDGFGATLSDVNFTATCLNELHNNCRDDVVPFVAHPTDENLPIEFGLGQNYPNPFNPLTEISFALPNAARVTLEIFNIMGQKVATVVDGSFGAGHHSVTWNSGRNASGVYFYRLQADAFVDTKKMLLLK